MRLSWDSRRSFTGLGGSSGSGSFSRSSGFSSSSRLSGFNNRISSGSRLGDRLSRLGRFSSSRLSSSSRSRLSSRLSSSRLSSSRFSRSRLSSSSRLSSRFSSSRLSSSRSRLSNSRLSNHRLHNSLHDRFRSRSAGSRSRLARLLGLAHLDVRLLLHLQLYPSLPPPTPTRLLLLLQQQNHHHHDDHNHHHHDHHPHSRTARTAAGIARARTRHSLAVGDLLYSSASASTPTILPDKPTLRVGGVRDDQQGIVSVLLRAFDVAVHY